MIKKREIRLDQEITGDYLSYLVFAQFFKKLERWFYSEACDNKIVWVEMDNGEHVMFEKIAYRVVKSSFMRVQKPDFLQQDIKEFESSHELMQKIPFSRKRGRNE